MRNIIVVGAGPAGLTAAYQLLRDNDDVRVIVLEQGNQVGGISKTVVHNGNRIDLGGHRFFSKDDRVNALWLDILKLQGVPISPDIEMVQKKEYPGKADPNTEDDVMLLRRRVSRIYYKNKFFDYPLSLDMQTLKKLGFYTSLRCAAGYLWSRIFKCKGDSLEDFYIDRFGQPLYALFFKEYTTKLWGVSPAELDASWGAQRVKRLSLSKMVVDFLKKSFNKNYVTGDASLIEQFYYPKFGPGQLWERMAERIEQLGGKILYNATCLGVMAEGDCITTVKIADGAGQEVELTCDYLISSMPVKDLIAAMGAKVPQAVKNIAEALPYRDFVTVGVLANKLCLKNVSSIETLNDIPPDCWIYVQDSSVKMGRIQVFNNWSPFLVKAPADTVWIGLEYFCSEDEELWNFSEHEMKALALGELQKMGIIAKDDVIDTVVLKQKKAYPAYFGAYKDFEQVKAYLNSYNNLVCVGRNGQHRYNNMDHSMLTGLYAAEYINGKTDIQHVWNVNTEQEYHEGRSDET